MACCVAAAQAVTITVEGLSDLFASREPVRFRTVGVDGYTDTARLDGTAVAVSEWILVELVGYHELEVTRTPLAGGESETARFRFVILDPVRGNAEVGLAPWTPHRAVPSAPEEFTGARLALVVPRRFPADLPLPLIGSVRDGAGERVGVNGVVDVTGRGPGMAGLQLRRGIGSALVAPGGSAGPLTLVGQVQGLTTSVEVMQDQPATWTEVTGDVSASTVWAGAGRFLVLSNFTVRAGATLTVEAGAVVLLAPRVEITVEGTLDLRGTVADPVVFMPREPGRPWGGFLLLSGPARVEAAGAFFTGTGADARFYLDRPLGGTHRKEQAAFHLGPGVQAVFRDCWFVDLAGQALHGAEADLLLERCLVQRCLTMGQFNGGSVRVRDSALIEFPVDDPRYEDGDHDAIYLTLGSHQFSNTLIGWSKDDGIDAGGHTPGQLRVERCWFESCFHEGMALSGTDKMVTVSESVFLNSGQAVETGYFSPQVTVADSLLAGNGVGARFGDNYGGGSAAYLGFLRVTNSILLHNGRDIWGMEFTRWVEAVERMAIEGNWVSKPHPAFLQNAPWDGAQHGAALARFRNPGADVVGAGFLADASRWLNADGQAEVLVGLSSFTEREVRIAYRIEERTARAGRDYEPVQGALIFTPGEVTKTIGIPHPSVPERRFSTMACLVLDAPSNASFGNRRPEHALRFLTVPTEGDEDADGLPDTWERAVVDADPSDGIRGIEAVHTEADFDGDGMSNQDEFLAGTDAADAGDWLRLRVVASDRGVLGLEFDARPGRSYRLEAAAALGDQTVWQSVRDVPRGPGPDRQAVRTELGLDAAAGFYRLVTLP